MTVQEAIWQSGSTFSAYRYHDGELIWATFSFSGRYVIYGDSIGYVNGQAVFPTPEKYLGKEDWEPWPKLKALPANGKNT